MSENKDQINKAAEALKLFKQLLDNLRLMLVVVTILCNITVTLTATQNHINFPFIQRNNAQQN